MSFEHSTPLELGDWSFDFQHSQIDGNVDGLSITVTNIPKENWPFLVPTTLKVGKDGIPVFPFETQSNAFGFLKVRDHIEKLEGMLSLFGVYEFDFSSISVEWLPDEGDELTSGAVGWKQTPRPPEQVKISENQLLHLIPAAGLDDLQLFSLAHFRIAQAAGHKGNYIEAIRHCYLFFEELFADGNSKKIQSINAFKASVFFCSNCSSWMTTEKVRFEKLRDRRLSWFKGNDELEQFFSYLTNIRGHLQHAKKTKSRLAWSPNRQYEFELDANCLLDLAFQISQGVIDNAMKTLKNKASLEN